MEVRISDLYGDRWRCHHSLKEGGQSWTYVVTDEKGDAKTEYVLKRFKNPKRIDRFKKEVESLRSLEHANVLRIVDFDLDAEEPYLVTEYCQGGSLEDTQEQFWRESPIKALATFEEICAGVACAHTHGVIHRDLKPANIFLRNVRGPAVVADFGLCFLLDEDQDIRITSTQEAVGPRWFMAPELEDGRIEHATKASDVYSLGKVLHWLLSGGKVFSREKHRDVRFDLKGRNLDTFLGLGWDNIYLEHVNRLLDSMIVFDPEKRCDVANILTLTRQVGELIANRYPPITKDIAIPCQFCGLGVYQHVPTGGELVGGTVWQKIIHSGDFRVLVCKACGHIQLFDSHCKTHAWVEWPS